MSVTARLLASAATATLAATPAIADLTADDIWASWQQTMTDMGQTVEVASVGQVQGRLTLDGVKITMDDADVSFTVLVDQIVMSEQGDGSVAVAVSPEYAMQVTAMGAEGEEVVMDMTLANQDLEMTATGDPDAISYAYAVSQLELTLDSMTEGGEPVDMAMSIGFDTVSGTYNVAAGTPQTIESALTAEAVAATIDVNEPEEDADFSMDFTMQGFSTTSTGTMSPFAGGTSLPEFLRAGLTSEGTATYGASTYKVDAVTPDGQVIVEGSASSGSLDFSLTEDGMRYGGGNTDVAMNVVAPGAMMPPIAFQIARTNGEVTMPLIASEDSKPIGLKMELDGLVLNDMLWAMVDPTGGLPRDPAGLLLDLSGMGNWFIDISDPEAVEAMELEGEIPGQVDNIDINALELSLAGADLTGSGAFAFNNDTMPPAPSGQVDLQLVGANALIDRLVSIGLIPEDQAMGARMMLGLFARPGEGDDTLVSTIEVKEDGAVIANGQRIR